MTKDEEEKWFDRLCADPTCPNLAIPGIIYCEICHFGRPKKAPEEIQKHFLRGKYYIEKRCSTCRFQYDSIKCALRRVENCTDYNKWERKQ